MSVSMDRFQPPTAKDEQAECDKCWFVAHYEDLEWDEDADAYYCRDCFEYLQSLKHEKEDDAKPV